MTHAHDDRSGFAPIKDSVDELEEKDINTTMQSLGSHQKQTSLIAQSAGPEASPGMYLVGARALDADHHDNNQARDYVRSTQDSPPSLMQRKFMAADVVKEDSMADWNRRVVAIQEGMNEQHESKEWYFFYSSLIDPKQLQRVLGLKERPRNLVLAEIVGYYIQMWGLYPALLDSPPGNVVKGMAYKVEGGEDKDKLAAYETNNYTEHKCTTRFEGGSRLSGTTFEWVGDMGDLKEGSFDLKDWQMAHLLED